MMSYAKWGLVLFVFIAIGYAAIKSAVFRMDDLSGETISDDAFLQSSKYGSISNRLNNVHTSDETSRLNEALPWNMDSIRFKKVAEMGSWKIFEEYNMSSSQCHIYKAQKENGKLMVLQNSCFDAIGSSYVFEDGRFQERPFVLKSDYLIATFYEHCCSRVNAFRIVNDSLMPVTVALGNVNFAFVDSDDLSIVHGIKTNFQDSINPFIFEYECIRTPLNTGVSDTLLSYHSFRTLERDYLLDPDDSTKYLLKKLGYNVKF